MDYDDTIDKVSISVPNMDKNQCVILDTDDIDISCQYDRENFIAEIDANKSGLIALAKIFLQLAYSTHKIAHIELDEYGYLNETSCAISIEKKNNT